MTLSARLGGKPLSFIQINAATLNKRLPNDPDICKLQSELEAQKTDYDTIRRALAYLTSDSSVTIEMAKNRFGLLGGK